MSDAGWKEEAAASQRGALTHQAVLAGLDEAGSMDAVGDLNLFINTPEVRKSVGEAIIRVRLGIDWEDDEYAIVHALDKKARPAKAFVRWITNLGYYPTRRDENVHFLMAHQKDALGSDSARHDLTVISSLSDEEEFGFIHFDDFHFEVWKDMNWVVTWGNKILVRKTPSRLKVVGGVMQYELFGLRAESSICGAVDYQLSELGYCFAFDTDVPELNLRTDQLILVRECKDLDWVLVDRRGTIRDKLGCKNTAVVPSTCLILGRKY